MNWDEYKKTLEALGYGASAIDIIKPAFEFAQKMHANEKRASGDSYIIHPIAVSLNIAQIKLDANTVAAALLHDVVENQGVKIETLKKQFGDDIAFLVDAVSKVDKIQYHGVERTVESLRKMFLALAQDIRVVIIKLMDRMHNMETLSFLPSAKQNRIALETIELYAPLADRLGMGKVKVTLEDLAFPFLFPEEYEWLKTQVEKRVLGSDSYLAKLKLAISIELKKENVIPVRIIYRTKHLFSLWKKLAKYEMNFDKILDIIAIRVVLSNVEDCYRTLGVVHKLWKPMPGRIKDYIALPKPNGYRSLHTTIFGPDKKIVDFQIRTEEMDREGEYGIAAHWVYEEHGKSKTTDKLDDKKFSWVKQLQEWYRDHEHVTKEEALTALKIDFFKDRIFALTPKGDVVDLPEGSTPVDFAYHIHSQIGDKMFGVKVNGKMVAFSQHLKSGDTVEILTQKNKKPTSDWLEFAKSSLAKNRIRSYLRKEGLIDQPKKSQPLLEATITAEDRVGLLKDFSGTFAKLGINILYVRIDPKNKVYPKTYFHFHPKKDLPLSKILTALRKIEGVEDVTIKEVK